MSTLPTRSIGQDKIPALGAGTFGSDKYSAQEVAAAVLVAAEIGYRHFDCAKVYGNEKEIGESLKSIQTNGIPREDLWITSKVWNNRHHEVEASCEESLRDLGLDYLDLFLVHWPFPNHHAAGVTVDSRDPHAVPFDIDRYMKTWEQMERLAQRGLVRHIGTSNMTIPKLEALLSRCSVKPSANELELHPHFQQPALFDYLTKQNIVPIGYCPIGSPSRPERDRTPEDTADTEDAVIVHIAEELNVHPAVVCVLWQLTLGAVPIPFSVKRAQLEATFQAATTKTLTENQMALIRGIDKNCRLIKGQVFLWQEAKDWHDLWDEA